MNLDFGSLDQKGFEQWAAKAKGARKPLDRATRPPTPALTRARNWMLSSLDLQRLVFGRFTVDVTPYHGPILVAAFAVVTVGGLLLLGTTTRAG